MYADVLKQRFSLAPNTTTSTTNNIRPPHKRQAAIIDYDSDCSTAVTDTTTVGTNNDSTSGTPKITNASTNSSAHAMELASIKKELTKLHTMITDAVEQFKTAIASLATTHTTQPQTFTDMDTEGDTSMQCNKKSQKATDLADIIQDLKYELATIITEM